MIAKKLTNLSEIDNAIASLESNPTIPFRSNAWLSAWAGNFLGARSEACCVAAYEDDRITGLAPFYRHQSAALGNSIQFLGDGKACTDYSTILIRSGFERQVCDCLSQFFTDHNGEWDRIVLDGVAGDDPFVKLFCDLMSEQGSFLASDDGMPCWRLNLPESWEALLSMLSKSHRKQVRRVQNRLIEQPGFDVVEATSTELVHDGLEILIDLHQRRWESRGGDGCFSSAAFRDFISDAAYQLFASDQLQLIWIKHDGIPIAVDFNLVSPEGVFGYQGGVSPEHLDLQPGRAMNIVSLMKAVESGKRFFDFLRGDEEYKPHWRAEPVPTKKFTIVPNRIVSRARHGISQFGKDLKTLIKPTL